MAKNSGDAASWSPGDMQRDQEAVRENWVVISEQWVGDEAEARRVPKKVISQARRSGKLVDYVKAPGRQGGFMVRVHEDQSSRKKR
jgi:hypothetical protein